MTADVSTHPWGTTPLRPSELWVGASSATVAPGGDDVGLECTNCGWAQSEDAGRCPKCGATVGKTAFGGGAGAALGPTGPAPVNAAGPSARGRAGNARWSMVLGVGVVVVGVAVWSVGRTTGPRLSGVTVRDARVVGVSGPAVVGIGDRCSVRVEPASGRPYNCRVVVQCGAHVLYGAKETNGYAQCVVEAGVALHAAESVPNDSDPDLYYDVPTARATVKDPTWQVDLALLPESDESG